VALCNKCRYCFQERYICIAVAEGIRNEEAWRMLNRIRKAISKDNLELFAGIVEIDETYVGKVAYAMGDIHTNGIESFWTLLKRVFTVSFTTYQRNICSYMLMNFVLD
jgi:hypothetical protein